MRSSIIASALPVFAVLQHVARADGPLSLADISRGLGLPVSTVHRLLGTLEQAGYVARYLGSSKFVPGLMPHHLCRALFNRFPLSAVSAAFLERLAQSARETVTLTVRIGLRALRIEVVGDATDLAEIAGPGAPSLLHETLEGRAILAALPARQFAEYRVRAAASGNKVPAANAKLWGRLRSDRAIGFATIPADRRGHSAIALPVRWRDEPIGAIGIVGPVIDGPRRITRRVREWMDLRDALEQAFSDAHPAQLCVSSAVSSRRSPVPE